MFLFLAVWVQHDVCLLLVEGTKGYQGLRSSRNLGERLQSKRAVTITILIFHFPVIAIWKVN